MALAISFLDVVLSAAFTVLVGVRWIKRRRVSQLLWSIALLVWTIAVAAETVAAYRSSWDPLTYRFYYAFGALLVAPWLGAGSVFLVASRRVAVSFFAFVLLLSVVGSALIFTYAVDPALLTQTDALGFVEVKVFPFVPVRLLIVVGNVLGTIAFVGSTLYSVWEFRQRRLPRGGMIGVLLIGAGGLVAASAHSIGALGGPGLFRTSELLAVVLIFGGYLLNTAATKSVAHRA
jgi:hypothetical protein